MNDISQCSQKQNQILEGPVCEKNSQIVYYLCNLLAKLVHCKNHTDHIKFNIKICIIQENAQCQEHWINHVENFDETEDIKVDFKLLFHKNQLIKNGRNYIWKTVK